MKDLLGRTRRPDITFHHNGKVDITSRVSRLLGIESGDVIDIATDGMEYYLFVKHKRADIIGRHEGQVYATYRGKCRNFRTYSKRLCEAMMSKKSMVARLPVGEVEFKDGKKMLPIITMSIER